MSIDIGKAAFAGFALIGPLSVLVWCVVGFVFGGLPVLYFMHSFIPEMMRTMQETVQEGPSASPTAALHNMLHMQQFGAMHSLMLPLGIALRGVLTAAVLRAVLQPENRGFFYLRLGAQELWQMLLLIAMFFVMLFFMLALIIVCALLFVAAHALGSMQWLGYLLVSLAAVIATIVFVLKLSLAPAMTFAERSFRLFESWRMTRGHVGALFLIVLILIALVIVVEIVGSSRVDLQACKLEYSIVSPK